MKVHNYLIGTLVAVLLIVSTANAQGHGSPGGMGHMPQDGGHMMDGTSHMTIDGNIVVEDAIILTITIQPNEETMDRMEQRHGSANPEDFTNEIEVRFTSLVEFIDITGDGYSSDDSIIGSFELNDQTLKQPVLVDDTYYQVASVDGITFLMTIDLTFEDNVFYGFKWSIDIQYPFQSSESDLAFIHEVSTSRGSMAYNHRHQHHLGEGTDYMLNQTQMMNDGDEKLPMFFSWVNEVTVDGEIYDIIATLVSDNVVITVPQGDSINYDPAIGVEPSAIEPVENELASLTDFLASIMSPTYIGLFLGLAVLVGIAIYTYNRKRSLA